MKYIRHIVSVFIILLVTTLAVGTIVEKLHGPDYAMSHVYGTWWFVALWAVFAILAAVLTFRNKNWKRPVVLTLFLAVTCILLGALFTMLTGQHGEMTLQPHVANKQFTIEKNGNTKECELPFTLTLDHFEVETYPGTHTPMDFVSHLQVNDNNTTTEAKISMNNILKHKGYRFYQSNYDEKGNSVLAVAHDPWGIAITYTGYILLLLAIVFAFIEKDGEFRSLIRKASGKAAILLVIFGFGCSFSASAANKPRALPKESADKMGQMYVMYKGRVCPLQTLAKDFTTKLCGSARYKGFTSEQVFSGWIFYYDDWKDEPMNHAKPAEKEELLAMLNSGKLLKIFPHADSTQTVTWYSPNDKLPLDIPEDEYLFIRKQLSLCKEYVLKNDIKALDEVFEKTKIYQEKNARGHLPSKTQYRAERLYNRLSAGKWLAITCITMGLVCFALSLICLGKKKPLYRPVRIVGTIWVIGLCAFLALIFILRWIVGGHIPMAGGFDSMNLMAFLAFFWLKKNFFSCSPFTIS